MGQLLIDANYNRTPILEGPPRGGMITTGSNNWSRLMPSNNNGAIVTEADGGLDYERMLNIDAYALPLRGWSLRILNAGYQQVFKILEQDAGGITKLDSPIEHRETLLTAVEWVVFPDNVLPIVLHNLANVVMDIGVLTDPLSYAVSAGNIVQFAKMRQYASIEIPTHAVDQICYKRTSGSTGIEMSWGEGIVGNHR